MDILKDVMGFSVKYSKWGRESRLPFYLSNGYSFRKARIEGLDCLIIDCRDELPTLPALKKQIVRIQKEENIPVVIKIEGMSAFRKKNMIENKIPFIIGERQVFLPFIGTYLQNREESPFKTVEKFMVSAQVLFLLYIYHRGRELYLAEATETLPYSAMTMTRASRQLMDSGLFHLHRDGVNKVLEASEAKGELYERAKPFLSTPVLSSGYLAGELCKSSMAVSNVSALAERSMLNQELPMHFAVGQGEIEPKRLQKELINPYEQNRIEIWKYPPALFCVGNIVDPVSLALSLAGDADERVESAIEEMLNRLWEGKIDGYWI